MTSGRYELEVGRSVQPLYDWQSGISLSVIMRWSVWPVLRSEMTTICVDRRLSVPWSGLEWSGVCGVEARTGGGGGWRDWRVTEAPRLEARQASLASTG